MKKAALLAVLIVYLSFGTTWGEPLVPPLIDKSINKGTNIHFSGKFCTECHLSTPKPGEPQTLLFGNDYIKSCRCHGYLPETYIHPVYITPSPSKKTIIPVDMPLQDGKITCATCHEIHLQCRINKQAQSQNSAFLRGAPYVSRTGICQRCHDQDNYKMLNPHNQLDYDGQIVKEKCLYCHTEVPDVEKSSNLPSDIFLKKIQLIGDLTDVCGRCHPNRNSQHPIKTEHFLKPSAKVLAAMQQSEKLVGTLLPLDHRGRITCPTCHNPHEQGVISPGRIAATGAGEKYRLRVPGLGTFDQICNACHEK